MYSVLRENTGLAAALLALAAPLAGQITEWPETVKPGKVLVEMDALSLFFDREAGAKYTALAVASTFVTTGLTPTLDVQVGADVYVTQKFDDGGFRERRSGIGDVYFRTKWNFHRTEDGTSMAALLPYVIVPTTHGWTGSKKLQGGVIVPWCSHLPGGTTLNAMAQLDFLRNDDDDGYDSNWYSSLAVSRPLTQRIGLYGEATAGKSSGGGPWAGTVGGGVTVQSGLFWWWDLAVYRGVSRGATDWNPVVRLNWEF